MTKGQLPSFKCSLDPGIEQQRSTEGAGLCIHRILQSVRYEPWATPKLEQGPQTFLFEIANGNYAKRAV